MDTEIHIWREHQEEAGVMLPQAQEPPESRRQDRTGSFLAPSEEVGPAGTWHRLAPSRTGRQGLSVIQSMLFVLLCYIFPANDYSSEMITEWSCFCLAQSRSHTTLSDVDIL